mmetsp:Transcript_34689/g.80219  ORF Transcript_34689/g.80219 Transcript_34689/m.80219 type:complete len:321 (-) Transcript_34689:330-1292(-)|eukprot:CAMPEP_0113309660 /NCGR_PEP_ID=MMETSP0010_2-20120614/7614_1 /TAXON_ID=216773 ORGANISM="Corethron hystrix, Strain 308" /NCGR_SAMPLE_ID=MMETSP0010_2 /ASSEMBLY_ACC=CAM_ASM_000155 /LENGTH=320 /DNA_ID=CAMNT_0000164955 /DNA_START=57 /DNA_END=1019 /DNA_ORIENTATION=+ /assembly_acc=CAM_ASM_000155
MVFFRLQRLVILAIVASLWTSGRLHFFVHGFPRPTIYGLSCAYSRRCIYTLPPQLSTILSSNRRSDGKPSPYSPTTSLFGREITSSLISALAITAVRLRLSPTASVSCDVTASPTGLIGGRVDGVIVSGKNWRSPLNLTCRLIEASVKDVLIDYSSVVTRQKLLLRVPARGRAMVAMNESDFGNFLVHPSLTGNGGSDPPLEFEQEKVAIDREKNTVTFFGLQNNNKWMCVLRRGGDEGATVAVTPVDMDETRLRETVSDALELTKRVTDFFTTIVFELDGTYLSINDIKVSNRGKSKDSVVMLALDIMVKKFPSPNAPF